MKTAEELCRIEYDDNRPNNIFMERQVDMKWAIFMMKRYAKQLLEEYNNRIVENAKANIEYNGEGQSDFDAVIDKESITSQLEIFLKEFGG